VIGKKTNCKHSFRKFSVLAKSFSFSDPATPHPPLLQLRTESFRILDNYQRESPVPCTVRLVLIVIGLPIVSGHENDGISVMLMRVFGDGLIPVSAK
jgi:hypothetical protein